MAIYTVHSRVGAADDPVFVKDGFSWPGFFFTLFWLLLQRMWIVALLVLAYLIATSLLAATSGQEDFWRFLFNLVLSLMLGFEGNDLRRWSLARRGYREVALIEARDLEEAELKFFADREPIMTPPPSEPRAAPADPLATDALGLFGKP